MKIMEKDEGLMKIGSNLIDCAEELDSSIKRINSAVEGISGAWEGPDFSNFRDVTNSKYVFTLQNLTDSLREYGEFLKKVPSYYEKSDSKSASKKINI